jgi:hypothetical protein
MAEGLFIDVTEGGILASHPERVELPVNVGTTTLDDPNKHNTVRPALITVGCWGVPDTHFDFDSSFIRPEIKKGLAGFAALRKRLVDRKSGDFPPASVFGHADPVGNDEYNKQLSGRRAQALYALLTRRDDLWEEIHAEWGDRAIQTMLTELGFYEGDIDGKLASTESVEAIKAFQEKKNDDPAIDPKLPVNGVANKTTRKQLYLSYMDALCQEDAAGDGNLKPYQLKKEDFLAQGTDHGKGGANGKGDYQGCSEFNPLRLFSKKEEREFAHATGETKKRRDTANEVNRRVLVFLFKPGSKIDPEKWPCPRAKEGTIGCKARFWSDGEDRRNRKLENARREYQKIAKDIDTGEPVGTELEETFACRFYYGISLHSPCEAPLKVWRVRLLSQRSKKGAADIPIAGCNFVVTAGQDTSAAVIRGQTTDDGEVVIPVFDEVTTIILKLDANLPLPPGGEPEPPGSTKDSEAFPGEEHFIPITLRAGALHAMKTGDNDAEKQRLHNLGYGPRQLDDWEKDPAHSDLEDARHQFREDQGMGDDDPDTSSRLIKVHGS